MYQWAYLARALAICHYIPFRVHNWIRFSVTFLFVACIAPSNTMEASECDEASQWQLDFLHVLSLKYVVSSAIGSYHYVLEDNEQH